VKYVLDANIAIAALNDVGAVRQRLSGVPGSEVGVPIVAVAELLFLAPTNRSDGKRTSRESRPSGGP